MNFIHDPLSRMFQFQLPSNLILNVALQISLSNCKLVSSITAHPCLTITPTNISRISKAEYSCKSSKNKLESPWSILFFGTDQFSVKSLELLCAKYRTNTLITKLEVVSSIDGKDSPVKKFAKDEKLVLHNWPIDPKVIKNNYDVGMVVSFGHLIPSNIINAFPLGMVNVHGSILPRWRGAAPIVHAILNGDHETGISIIRIRPKHFDRGEIIRQYRCPISPYDTAMDLHERLSLIGGQLLLDCVRDMPRCIEKATPQHEEGATYAPKINSSYSVIDWSTMNSLKIYNLHRALGHIYPLLTQWNGVKVKLHDISLDLKSKQLHRMETAESIITYSDRKEQISTKLSSAMSFLNDIPSPTHHKRNINSTDIVPGEVQFDKSRKVLKVKCLDGSYFLCPLITVSGKKKMSATDFNNGFLGKVKSSDRKFVNLDRQLHSVDKK